MNALSEGMEKYNNTEYIESSLKNIKDLRLTGLSFEDFSHKIRRYLGSLPFIVCTIKAGNFIARARTKEDDRPYELLSQITLRESKYVKSFGRAHCPGQAVFYGSSDEKVAIREATQWHIKDFNTLVSRNMLKDYNPHTKFVTVGVWKIVSELKLVSLFLNKNAMSINPVAQYFGEKLLYQDYHFGTKEFIRSRNLVLQFFSDEFAKREIKGDIDYWLSAYYANEVYNLAKEYSVDGIAYPTVALDYKGVNFALTEKAYREKVEFVNAFHNYVFNLEMNNQPMQIGEILEVIERKGDILTWKDIPTGEIFQ